jgi:aspartate 1-decarboxylase
VRRTMMRAKIHRATVTDSNIDYVGSISLSPELMHAADIREFEQLHVVDVTNGARLVTYAIAGQPGEVCLNGAAAHLVHTGDLVIVIAYTDLDETELEDFEPRIVHVDRRNKIVNEATARELAKS